MNPRDRLRLWQRRGIKIGSFLDYMVLFDIAQGRCEACGQELSAENGNSDKPTAQLDHDHRTGEPRGILCANCNRTIGFIETYNYKNRHGIARYMLKDGGK